MDLQTFRHQALLLKAPSQFPDIPYHFLIGGYGCGKSFSGVLLILKLYYQYNGKNVVFGIGGTSQTLLRKTLLTDLFKTLETGGIAYSHNKLEHIVTIGTVQFIYIGTASPEQIYAYNFSGFICDELDELPQEKAIDAFKAIQERTRVVLPDGRNPVSIFMTTAQGLRGTYRIIQDLKESGTPYIKIRGLTKDNTTLSSDYVNRLYSLYTDNERSAFLEGNFVDLYTGRVYPEYIETQHLVGSFPIDPLEPIYIGQDINSGFSKGVAFVIRDQNMFAVKEYSFPVLGDAPRLIRNDFPTNEVFWYPDASAKEIMAGYQKEVKSMGIRLRIGTVNPSVTERIFTVNKLFRTGRLKVFKDLKQYPIALKTRQFDKRGDPEKGQGPKAPDHICDAGEYVIWRLVSSLPIFRDLYDIVKHGNENMEDAA